MLRASQSAKRFNASRPLWQGILAASALLDLPPESVHERGANVVDNGLPPCRQMLMKQSGAGIPGRRAAPGGPAPVAIRMQHYPRFTTKRSRQMHNHGVDADDEIQFADPVTELHDIWRADVPGSDLSRVFLSRSPLQ